MSNYVQSTNFATKDALASGDPLKIVRGTEINTEFANIAVAVATKADLASPAFTGTPTAPTQSSGNNSTALASTAFVQAAISGGSFPAGTAMLFAQTAAPTGFTKSLTHDNKALRVVTGSASSGGTTAFTAVFTNQTPTITTSGLSVGATTLTTAQIASHTHTITAQTQLNAGGVPVNNGSSNGCSNNITTNATGGGGSHDHTISGTATSSAVTLNVQYVDVIIATKD